MRAKTLTAVVLVWLVVAATPGAHAGDGWSGPLYPLNGATVDFGNPIEGSNAAYTNGAEEITFSVDTNGLTEGHAYTIWLMVFNHPENCLGPDGSNGLQCGQTDHFNPMAGFSVMYGTGEWAEGEAVHFEGTREGNSPLAIPSDVLIGPGLVNPAGAEVHFRVRDHGPEQECCADDQVTTIGGGCTLMSSLIGPGERGDYECADVQATGS